MTACTPDVVATHLRSILAPAVTAISADGDRDRQARRIIGCASILDHIDLASIAISLAGERTIAAEGRPRLGSAGGPGSTHSTHSTTDDVAGELYRLRSFGIELREALDRLHPDPDWPTIASGARARTSTATEFLAATIDEIRTGTGEGDLIDAVDNLVAATQYVEHCARRAWQARAWRGDRVEVDPPSDEVTAARCSGWPQGQDRHGENVCGEFRSVGGFLDEATGKRHHHDLCHRCYGLLCPVCRSRVRRSPGASECEGCWTRKRRGRVA